MAKRKSKLLGLRERQIQIERLQDADARALGYQNYDVLYQANPIIPEDFAEHLEALELEMQQNSEAIEQIELRALFGPNIIVFPFSRRQHYDKATVGPRQLFDPEDAA